MKNLIVSLLLTFFNLGVMYSQTYPEMITVEGGTFTMGSSKEEKIGIDECPSHSVTVSSFQMSETSVTVAQYRFYCEMVGRDMPKKPRWGWFDDHPVVFVNWYDAVAYCDWLSGQTGKHFRLPTEAEWEYAARGGDKSRRISYKDSLDLFGWYKYNSNGSTQPVKLKKPNELGLYDMIGNVLEMCLDWYDLYYYRKSPPLNPKGPDTGVCRVLRGGSWLSTTFANVTRRDKISPNYGGQEIGFRIVLAE